MAYWGYHATLDCRSCDKALISNKSVIEKFAKELVHRIEMVAYGEPMVVHFGEDNKAGYTLVQLIETSNICGHFCDETGDAYIDVFSCKEYDLKKVIETVEEFFTPDSIRCNFLTRQA